MAPTPTSAADVQLSDQENRRRRRELILIGQVIAEKAARMDVDSEPRDQIVEVVPVLVGLARQPDGEHQDRQGQAPCAQALLASLESCRPRAPARFR